MRRRTGERAALKASHVHACRHLLWGIACVSAEPDVSCWSILACSSVPVLWVLKLIANAGCSLIHDCAAATSSWHKSK